MRSKRKHELEISSGISSVYIMKTEMHFCRGLLIICLRLTEKRERKRKESEKVGSVDSGSGEHTMNYEGYQTFAE